MSRNLITAACLAATLGMAHAAPSPAVAQPAPSGRMLSGPDAPGDPAKLEKEAEARAATFGLGAIMGVATYNMLSTAAAASVVGAAAAIGASAGIVWARNTYNDENTQYTQLVPVAVGGLAGVAAGDLLAMSILGYAPFAAGAGGMLPSFAFSLGGIATSMYVYTSGVLGARAADLAATAAKDRK